MAELAFLFPGQGSQKAGMGKALADTFEVARRTFEEADDVLGFSLSALCFNGPESELKRTENTQPAILAVSTAAAKVLEEQGIRPNLVAGHSLGEYSALVAAGSLAFADALRLVRRRGQLMQEAVPEGTGAMAAILKLSAEKVLEIVAQATSEDAVVTAANFNSPEQTVIAGHVAAVDRAIELAKEAGAKRAVRLEVSAPFHSPLMMPARDKLTPDLERTTFLDLKIPLVNNYQASVIRTGAEARQGLSEQIPSPVLWTQSVQTLVREGMSQFVEVGPGAVLTGLCRTINPDVKGAKFGDPADLEKLNEMLA
jgi:[acyl-carrier-protein] S-malonyltransferase